jgi:hypothetical protein
MKTITIETVVAAVRGFPTEAKMHAKRFADGLDYAEEMESVTIATNNVWGGRAKNGASVSSYEKIGYHAGSEAFLRGLVFAGCPVCVYRDSDDGQVEKFRLEGF